MMRGAFYSLSDSSANTAAVQPDMHFYSGQMSASSPALRIVCVAPEKVAASVVGTKKKKGQRHLGVDFAPTGESKSFCQAVVCHALTDISSKQINGEIRLYRRPGKEPSEWTKADQPSGTELSLPVSSLQPECALMYADLAADEVDCFRCTNNACVYFGEKKKSHILHKSVCTRYEFWPTAPREGKDRTMSRAEKTNLTHLYLSNCLLPVRRSQEMTQ